MTSDRVVVEADGGSRGNPGPAGYGAVVFDADRGRVLAERREFLGVATNNVAEYRGLIAGLAAARDLGAHEVDVRMDSKLVVEQMSGRWKVKHPDMIPLAQRARELADGFARVDFTWIPRAENSHADRLANEAMDGEDAITSGSRIPTRRPAPRLPPRPTPSPPPRRPPAGPARSVRRPACCCCATARPNCPSNAGTRATATRRSPRSGVPRRGRRHSGSRQGRDRRRRELTTRPGPRDRRRGG